MRPPSADRPCVAQSYVLAFSRTYLCMKGFRTLSHRRTMVGRTPMGRLPPLDFGIRWISAAAIAAGHSPVRSTSLRKVAMQRRNGEDNDATSLGGKSPAPTRVALLKVAAASATSVSVTVGRSTGGGWDDLQGAPHCPSSRSQISRHEASSESTMLCGEAVLAAPNPTIVVSLLTAASLLTRRCDAAAPVTICFATKACQDSALASK